MYEIGLVIAVIPFAQVVVVAGSNPANFVLIISNSSVEE